MQTSVAVGDSSPIFTTGLRVLAERTTDVSIALTARDEDQLVAHLLERPVDVVLSCFEPLAASARVARMVELPVVAMAWSHRTADVLDALRSGVRGLLTKSCDPGQVWDVVRAVRAGHLVYPHGWEQALREVDAGRPARTRRRTDEAALTNREAEIVHLLLTGMSARQVASRLGIAVQTVKNHVHHILGKLGLSSRAELQAWASDRGWDRMTDDIVDLRPTGPRTARAGQPL